MKLVPITEPTPAVDDAAENVSHRIQNERQAHELAKAQTEAPAAPRLRLVPIGQTSEQEPGSPAVKTETSTPIELTQPLETVPPQGFEPQQAQEPAGMENEAEEDMVPHITRKDAKRLNLFKAERLSKVEIDGRQFEVIEPAKAMLGDRQVKAHEMNTRLFARRGTYQPPKLRPVFSEEAEEFIQALRERRIRITSLSDEALAEVAPVVQSLAQHGIIPEGIASGFTWEAELRLESTPAETATKATASSMLKGLWEMTPMAIQRGAKQEPLEFDPHTALEKAARPEIIDDFNTLGATVGSLATSAGLAKAVIKSGATGLKRVAAFGAADALPAAVWSEELPGFIAELTDVERESLLGTALTTAEAAAVASLFNIPFSRRARLAKKLEGKDLDSAARMLSDETGAALADVEERLLSDPRVNGLDHRPDRAQIVDKILEKRGIASAEAKAVQAQPDEISAKPSSPILEDSKRFIASIFEPISSRLEKIHPQLRTKVREFEWRIRERSQEYRKQVEPFLREKKARMPAEDIKALDLALKNGRAAEVDALIAKHGLEAEFAQARTALDSLYEDARKAGFDVGYIGGEGTVYWPRRVKDPKAFLEFLRGKELSLVDDAIREAEAKAGRLLSAEERAEVANAVLRRPGDGRVTMGKPSNVLERTIEDQTALDPYYHDSDTAILSYIDSIVNNVEKRRFFGQNAKLAGGRIIDVDESIGAMVQDLVQKGEIKPRDEWALQGLLNARFKERSPLAVFQAARNGIYLTMLGNVTNALTQLGDLAFSAYYNGYWPTLRTLAGKKALKMEDIGIERIAQEFSEGPSGLSKALDKVFHMSGFHRIDRLGKETLINSSLEGYSKKARNLQKLPELDNELRPIFGDQTDQVIADLQEGTMSDNVRFLLFNRVLDVQPVALSEMPEAYLRNPNGRIFYSLKTFTLKQIDLTRREALSKISDGMKTGDKDLVKEGFGNLTKLAGALMVTNATADTLKDLVLNREIDMSDLAVENLWKVIGLSRYQADNAARKGVGTAAADTFLPPTRPVDDLSRDINDLAEGNFEGLDVRSIRNLPIVGQPLYWWFGRGAEQEQEK